MEQHRSLRHPRSRPAPAARVGEAVHDAFDLSRVRGEAAWDAVRGSRVGPPIAVRRWPWALGAAGLGALAGAAVALLLQRLGGQDAPGAQEPEDLEAVVDRPSGFPDQVGPDQVGPDQVGPDQVGPDQVGPD